MSLTCRCVHSINVAIIKQWSDIIQLTNPGGPHHKPSIHSLAMPFCNPWFPTEIRFCNKILYIVSCCLLCTAFGCRLELTFPTAKCFASVAFIVATETVEVDERYRKQSIGAEGASVFCVSVRAHTCICVLLPHKVCELSCGPLPRLWSVPS